MDRTPGVRPRPSLWRRLDVAFRYAFPVVLTAFGLFLLAAPVDLPAQAELQPGWMLASVYFWSLFRPNAVPPLAILLLGVFADLLGLDPLGVNVLMLLIVHGIALRGRRWLVRQGFLLVWLVFVVLAAGAVLLHWALVALLSWRLLPPGPGIVAFLLAAGFYPAVATLLTRAHRGLAAPELA